MSAEFDDIVARVRALALDELRAKNLHAYPLPSEVHEAERRLLGRIETALLTPETPRSAVCFTLSAEAAADLANGATLSTPPIDVEKLRRDGAVHAALAAIARPGRACD